MSDNNTLAEFRFYYFTSLYVETILFYKNVLQWEEVSTWDRGYCEKGTIFRSPNGIGLIEIEEGTEIPRIDGALYIQVPDVEFWYQLAIDKKINIVQPLTNTSYGHSSFKFSDPSNFTIGLFKYNPQ